MEKLRKDLKTLPKGPGIYLFKNRGDRPVYIGKSTNVYERVKSHLSAKGHKASVIIEEASSVVAIPIEYELEALLTEAALIKKHKPKFNSRAKDDKHPLYIKISASQDFPIVTTSRQEDESGSIYFGPFPSSGTVKEVLREVRKIFPFHSRKIRISGRGARKPCFYSHLGLCNPCPNEILKIKNKDKKRRQARIYQSNIRSIISLLSGKTDVLKRRLEKQMKSSASRKRFEEAAILRDQLRRLKYITTPYRKPGAYLENPELLADMRRREARELAKILKREIGINIRPHRVECFDVSHLYGRDATASMVTFISGEPEKSLYRHFRIRTEARSDDFSTMQEVIERRIRHFDDWGKPDLLIVDGGKPQISAATQILKGNQIDLPVVGLAKRNEQLVFLSRDENLGAKRFKKIKLSPENPGLQFIQRIRDEAHRFARAYHLKLRLKTLNMEE